LVSTTSATTTKADDTSMVECEAGGKTTWEPLWCAQATTELCDSKDWKAKDGLENVQCACHCRKLRPHIVMYLIDDMGFNDFAYSPDLQEAWGYLHRSLLPKGIHINTSYSDPLCAPSRTSFLSGRFFSPTF
jgi:hypothetical protein